MAHFAQNTLRAYRSDFNDFNTWCTSQQLTPEHITSEDIAKYLLPKAYFWIKHQYTIDIKQQHPISPMSYCNR